MNSRREGAFYSRKCVKFNSCCVTFIPFLRESLKYFLVSKISCHAHEKYGTLQIHRNEIQPQNIMFLNNCNESSVIYRYYDLIHGNIHKVF